MRISVAVITYNWPEAFELVLRSLANQTELPYEVIVTDDGSQPATRELLLRLAHDYPVRLVHLWQPDDGARMSRARNRAIAAAQGGYVILLDGDMVAERHFIADHRAFARRGCFAQRSRVLTDASSANDMLRQGPSFPEFFRRGIHRRRHTVRFPALARLFARPSQPAARYQELQHGVLVRGPVAPQRLQRGDDRVGPRGHRTGGTRLPCRPAPARPAPGRGGCICTTARASTSSTIPTIVSSKRPSATV